MSGVSPATISLELKRVSEIFSQSSALRISFGFTGFAEAFNAAKSQSLENDLLLVFGSFFLVSDCLNEFEKR